MPHDVFKVKKTIADDSQSVAVSKNNGKLVKGEKTEIPQKVFYSSAKPLPEEVIIAGKKPDKKESATFLSFILELVKIVVICVIIILPIRLFVMQPFYVKGASMEPNYSNGQYLIVDEISYRFREPRRGETIVFRYKDNKQYFIKRVIGLHGERVKIENNNKIIYNSEYLDGKKLSEIEYLDDTVITTSPNSDFVDIGENQVFVMGDNRGASLDSRRIGTVSYDDIIGRAVFRGFPFTKIGLIQSPKYNGEF